MTERQVLSAGIKLLGLCMLGLGLISACKALEAGWSAYSLLKTSPLTDKIGFLTVQSHSGPGTETSDLLTLSEHTAAAFQYMGAQRQFAGVVIQMFVGLYLCRGGKLILRFLCGKEAKQDAQGASMAPSGSGSP